MKKYLGILLTGLLLWWSCSDDDDNNYIEVSGVADAGEFVDVRDGKSYKCIEIGDQIWMAENLAYRLPEGSLGGCCTWKEAYLDSTTIEITDEEFREGLLSALETGEIDESYNQHIVDSLMIETGEEEGSLWWQIAYNDYSLRYLLSGYLNQTPNATYEDIMEAFANTSFYYFQNLLPSVLVVTSEIRSRKLEDIAGNYLESAEEENGNYSQTYGFLYSFEAAQRAVPAEGGWRIPSDEDWKKLERHIGMKEGDVNLDNEWRGSNQAVYLKPDEAGIGFNALYAGGKVYTPLYTDYDDETFINKGRNAYFWSSENLPETDSTRVGIIRSVAIWTDQILRATTRFTNDDNHPTLYSVRLVKDK